jgi:hypothetical protein
MTRAVNRRRTARTTEWRHARRVLALLLPALALLIWILCLAGMTFVDAVRWTSGGVLVALALLAVVGFTFTRSPWPSGLVATSYKASKSAAEERSDLRDTMRRLGAVSEHEANSSVLLAARTGRSTLSYGEWILAEIRDDQVTLVAWNITPSLTFGKPRSRVRSIAAEQGQRPKMLTRAVTRQAFAQLFETGLLVKSRGSASPAWM